jgi:hypothetical protein
METVFVRCRRGGRRTRCPPPWRRPAVPESPRCRRWPPLPLHRSPAPRWNCGPRTIRTMASPLRLSPFLVQKRRWPYQPLRCHAMGLLALWIAASVSQWRAVVDPAMGVRRDLFVRWSNHQGYPIWATPALDSRVFGKKAFLRELLKKRFW